MKKLPKNIFIYVTNNEFVKTYVRYTNIYLNNNKRNSQNKSRRKKKTSAKDDVVLIINLILKQVGVGNYTHTYTITHTNKQWHIYIDLYSFLASRQNYFKIVLSFFFLRKKSKKQNKF